MSMKEKNSTTNTSKHGASRATKKVVKTDKEKSVSKKQHSNSPDPLIIERGHLVSVNYVGTLSNGEEFDNSSKNGPVSFIVGASQVIKGFEDAVLGMKVNDKKKFSIKKEDAYGDINPALLHKVSLDRVPLDIRSQLRVGGYIVLQSPVGQQIPARVESLEKDFVVLDLNHPLAGKDLTFDIEIVSISIPDDSQKSLHNHNGCGCESCECEDDYVDDKDCCGRKL